MSNYALANLYDGKTLEHDDTTTEYDSLASEPEPEGSRGSWAIVITIEI